MKIRILTVFVMLIVLALSACQPTPERPIVIEKNDLEQKIVQTAAPQQPQQVEQKTWQEMLDFKSGVKVTVDADIDRPRVEAYPVLEVKPHEVTQEEAQKFADFFLQGQPIYEHEHVRSKDVIEQEIIMAQAYLEEAKTKKTYGSEEIRQMNINTWTDQLNRLKDEYTQIPEETSEPKPTTLDFKLDNSGYKRIAVEAFLGNTSPALFSIIVTGNNESHMVFKNETNLYYGTFNTTSTIVGLSITMQEAQVKAEMYLQELGISDLQLSSTETQVAIDITALPSGSDLVSDPEKKKCFVFHYSRVCNGIPITNVQPCYGMESEDGETEQFDRPWASEDISVSVDDSGVIGFQWDSPGDVVRTVNDNVKLKDFKDIKEIFKKQLFYQRTWANPGTKDNKITIKTIKLGYMRVKMRDENKYYLLPVWDFIGDWTYNERSQDISTENVSFLTLNAIDGSVINRYLGY